MGELYKISGPVVTATKMEEAKMYDLVKVGSNGLLGEIIQLRGKRVLIQVYEDTSGLSPGEKVETTGEPLTVELGPGLLKSIYDGVQRPLKDLHESMGFYIKSGGHANPLDRKKKWEFTPNVKKGDRVEKGDILGIVPETEMIEHKILSTVKGQVTDIKEGSFTIEQTIATISTSDGAHDHNMITLWDIRKPRPYKEKLQPNVPLVTGQRVIDTFFPLVKGGTAAIPGPFGSGKSVTQQTLTKFADAQVVVYIGCGERGNEMTDVLHQFARLKDPYSGRPLMERTILIANTSNMPVAAREASIYSGITIAEYFRDMGYDVALMADSISRWAEAMREISARLEEMPGEEGYPAYLGRRLAEFFERSGRVRCLGSDKRIGSVTSIAAVSPPGGDISEPVSQNTLRIVKVFLALDSDLAKRRHFPAINWLKSYSLYIKNLGDWYAKNVSKDRLRMQAHAMEILQKEAKLKDIVQLVGPDTIPAKEQIILQTARILREDYLQQDALTEIDCFTSFSKQNTMLSSILHLHERMNDAVNAGVEAEKIKNARSKADITKLKNTKEDEMPSIEKIINGIDDEFGNFISEAKK